MATLCPSLTAARRRSNSRTSRSAGACRSRRARMRFFDRLVVEVCQSQQRLESIRQFP